MRWLCLLGLLATTSCAHFDEVCDKVATGADAYAMVMSSMAEHCVAHPEDEHCKALLHGGRALLAAESMCFDEDEAE